MLAASEYTKRHDRALMVFCVELCKQEGLVNENTIHHKENWRQGKVLENEHWKAAWDFKYKMRTTSTNRRPDVTIESKKDNKIWLVDMACPSEYNVEEKHREKLQKYAQLAFEIRER